MRKWISFACALCAVVLFAACTVPASKSPEVTSLDLSYNTKVEKIIELNPSGTDKGQDGEETETETETAEPAPVRIEFDEEVFSADEAELGYSVINESGEAVYVVMAPTLERLENGEWTTVALQGVGFCGVPDRVDTRYDLTLPAEWYGGFQPGEYRMKHNQVTGEGYEHIAVVEGYFKVA